MDTSESGDERPHDASKESTYDDEKKHKFEIWKGHYEEWLAGYKIPFKHQKRDCQEGRRRDRSDEAHCSGSRMADGSSKHRRDRKN
ncbi:hypothetical protein AAVH_10965 [Aphelenchoides avenae]|nr:hypothetical protein AAVH_10965 [Aphelenchus avenae]